MLAGLLLNLPAAGRKRTGWFYRWREPPEVIAKDIKRAKKAGVKEVQAAIDSLLMAPVVFEAVFEPAIDLVKDTTARELMKDQEDVIMVLTAYFKLKQSGAENSCS